MSSGKSLGSRLNLRAKEYTGFKLQLNLFGQREREREKGMTVHYRILVD
jgi:hypothetical protein